MAKEEGKEKTQEEQRREVALKNLKSSKLVDIAASYIVNKSGVYGEAGDSAMEQFKYLPAFSSGTKAYNKDGQEYDLIKEAILSSREDGARYSGTVSEQKIMKDCAAIMQESLNYITIEDIMKLMGSKAEVKEQLKNVYIGNLVPKIPKEELAKLPEDEKKKIAESQKLYQNIIGSYQTYLTQKSVSEALAEGAKQIPKSLETILCEPEIKK
jgi:hypothetical protein